MANIVGSAVDIWRWWISELQDLIPGWIRTYLDKRKREVIIDISAARIDMRGAAKDKSIALPPWPVEGQIIDTTSEQFQELARMTKSVSTIVALLPARYVLRQTLTLPIAARAKLQEILKFEVERNSPLDFMQIYFDYHVVGIDKSSNEMEVETRIVKRDSIEDTLSLCRSLEIEPTELRVAGDVRPINGCDFLTIGNNSLAGRISRAATICLLALVCILSTYLVFSHFERQRATLDMLSGEIADAKRIALDIERMRDESKTLLARSQFISGKRKENLLTTILDEISRILPDGTWVFQLGLNGKEIQLRGFSATAAKLIVMIDESALFTNVRFRAPLTQGPRSKAQRFVLSFEVVPGTR